MLTEPLLAHLQTLGLRIAFTSCCAPASPGRDIAPALFAALIASVPFSLFGTAPNTCASSAVRALPTSASRRLRGVLVSARLSLGTAHRC